MTTSPVADGFAATLTAKPGRGDDLIRLMLSGLEPGNPATSEHYLVHLVSRSAGNPDVAHVIEGWTSEEDHHRVFATAAAQTIVAGFADRLEVSPISSRRVALHRPHSRGRKGADLMSAESMPIPARPAFDPEIARFLDAPPAVAARPRHPPADPPLRKRRRAVAPRRRHGDGRSFRPDRHPPGMAGCVRCRSCTPGRGRHEHRWRDRRRRHSPGATGSHRRSPRRCSSACSTIVSPYVSPARAGDLAGLPATYVDAGSAEVFRDEDQQYASRIWAHPAAPNHTEVNEL